MGRGLSVLDVDELPEKIKEARGMTFPPYEQDRSLVDCISGILEEQERKSKEHPSRWK